jgi:two-component system sensor histidine kinase DesK
MPSMVDPLASGPPGPRRVTHRLPPERDVPAGPEQEASFGAAQPLGLLERLSRVDTVGVRILYRLVWPGIWLVFVAYPISDILDGQWSTAKAVLAWALLAAFAALYLASMWLATGFQGEPEPRVRLVPYAAFIALTIGLVLGFGADFGCLLIYAGVVTGWTLRPRAATVGVLLLGALIASGLAVGYSLSEVAFFGFMTVALGATVVFYRAVIWLMIERRRAREEVAHLAVAEERLRFSRDLHDVLGHSLSVIALKSQVARRLLESDPAAARASLEDLEGVAHESLQAVREMVTGYRQLSLTEELRNAEEILSAAGIRAEMPDELPAPPSQVDGLLAWAVREGVTNLLRHSRAHTCRISIHSDAERIRLEISDDGLGAHGGAGTVTAGPGGSGLSGLRERMAAAGGTLDAGAGPGGGFRLRVEVPAR